jgi:GPH family glycoside/pentoside/hexuronide:cation symporter
MEITKKGYPKTTLRDIFTYSTGEGANSLVSNGIASFSMLYYTEALGLNYKLAGIAMAIAIFWDAVTDPLMAYISDNTHSRFGRRHPYILIGGILTAICFYFIWAVPEQFKDGQSLFWYLVLINLLLRTALTIFAVSYGALGFEVCTDYDDRAKLQGVKMAFNMAVNLAGPGMAWWIFFKDRPDGIEATSIAVNYVNMGTVFVFASLVFVVFATISTRKYIVDTRNIKKTGKFKFKKFTGYFKDIMVDKYSRIVFIFMAIVFIGVILVGSLQMYVYVYFMRFPAIQKSIVHSSGMIGCGLGAAIMHFLVKRFDKKPVAFLAVTVGVASNIMLTILFVTGMMPRDMVYHLPRNSPILAGVGIPVSMLIFLFFQGLYWLGNGVLFPLAGSMIADISEIGKYRTGELKDGGYGAMLSFIVKLSVAVGLLLSGFCLSWVGFVEGSKSQTPQAVRNLAATTFLSGAVIAIIAMVVMFKYPINRDFMHRIKTAIAARERGEEFEKIEV